MSLLTMSALVAMAFASVATAAPTALCKANEKACSAANTYAAGTTVKATAKDFKIETSAANYTCSSATTEFKTAASSGEPLKAELTSFSFSGCKFGTTSCSSVKSTNLAKPAIEQTGQDTGKASPFGAKWAWTCGELSLGTWDGTALEAQYGVGEFFFTEAGIECAGNCPQEGWLTAHFKVESPSPFYVEQGGGAPPSETTLCKVAETHCAAGNRYPSGTVFHTQAKPFRIYTSAGYVECAESTLEVNEAGPEGESLQLGTGEWTISEKCTRTKANDCTTKVLYNGNGGLLTPGYGSYNGLWTTERNMGFKVECWSGTPILCEFEIENSPEVGFETVFEGGNPAHFDLVSMVLAPLGGWACPEGVSLISAGNFTFTSPKAVYVAST